jgi:hypothetical protein
MTATATHLLSRTDFADAIGRAVREGTGYAAGKLGVTERAMLQYPLLVERGASRIQLLAFEQSLRYKASGLAGVFPAEADFYLRYAELYAGAVRRLDCVGIDTATVPATEAILSHHHVGGALIDYVDQEPDRSIPADDSRCYLPHFAGRRLLIVCPFAELLRERATRETFEAVWARTGKRWFEPASVEAIEFPYGFARSTQERYATCIDLLDEVAGGMQACDYDVALIAAGGALGIPLAAAARGHGKVAISLGGHLQALFGVLGDRWRSSAEWRRLYLNDAWVDMPASYRPAPGEAPRADRYW